MPQTNCPKIPFLTPHLETAKDISTKGEMQLYHHANFQTDHPHHCRDICRRTQTKRHRKKELHYSRL